MRPSPFRYTRPTQLAEALEAVRAGAVPLAGGQSLIQALRLGAAHPPALVDLSAVGELRAGIEVGERAIRVGALTTHAELAEHPAVAREQPWLAEAAQALGDVQVRNRGTVLGNVCWADPRANLPVALLASDARVLCASLERPSEPESLPLEALFAGFRRTALGERLAVALELPRAAPGTAGRYLELSRQRQDLALCNVCVVLGPGASGLARVAVGGVHDRPLRLAAIERELAARGPAAVSAREATRALDALELAPPEEPHGSPAYRRHLAGVLVERALRALAEAPARG